MVDLLQLKHEGTKVIPAHIMGGLVLRAYNIGAYNSRESIEARRLSASASARDVPAVPAVVGALGDSGGGDSDGDGVEVERVQESLVGDE